MLDETDLTSDALEAVRGTVAELKALDSVVHPKKLSGAQRKKDNRERVKNPKTGVWELKIWQPHPRVKRGRQS